jgi:hypothetical protein
LASATSNLIGFFDKEQKEGGKDFPKDAIWPFGFVPVPVHTTNIDNDYLVIHFIFNINLNNF